MAAASVYVLLTAAQERTCNLGPSHTRLADLPRDIPGRILALREAMPCCASTRPWCGSLTGQSKPCPPRPRHPTSPQRRTAKLVEATQQAHGRRRSLAARRPFHPQSGRNALLARAQAWPVDQWGPGLSELRRLCERPRGSTQPRRPWRTPIRVAGRFPQSPLTWALAPLVRSNRASRDATGMSPHGAAGQAGPRRFL